jgi:hypothetical protein
MLRSTCFACLYLLFVLRAPCSVLRAPYIQPVSYLDCPDLDLSQVVVHTADLLGRRLLYLDQQDRGGVLPALCTLRRRYGVCVHTHIQLRYHVAGLWSMG